MRILVLEGPEHDRLKGWRHFQIISYPWKVSSCIALRHKGREMAEVLRGKFYAEGTWEAHPANWFCKKCGQHWAMPGIHPDCDGESSDMVKALSAPLPEILDELVTNQTQSELAV